MHTWGAQILTRERFYELSCSGRHYDPYPRTLPNVQEDTFFSRLTLSRNGAAVYRVYQVAVLLLKAVTKAWVVSDFFILDWNKENLMEVASRKIYVHFILRVVW